MSLQSPFESESANVRWWLTGDSPAPFMPQLSFKSYSKDGADGLGDGAQQTQPEEKRNGWVYYVGDPWAAMRPVWHVCMAL
jgi:hypothetical protein